MNQIIEEQHKRILSLTEDHKHYMKRQIDDHNHLVSFIKNYTPQFNHTSSTTKFKSKLTNDCVNKCYQNPSDGTADRNSFENLKYDKFDTIFVRKNQLCEELCSKLTSILQSKQPQINNCSNSIPRNNDGLIEDQNNADLNRSVASILIRGQRIHSNTVTQKRWKEFQEIKGADNAISRKNNETRLQNSTLLRSVNGILNAALKPHQQIAAQKRSVMSVRAVRTLPYPSFQYEHTFLKGVENASIVRQVEDRNTTLINRMGG